MLRLLPRKQLIKDNDLISEERINTFINSLDKGNAPYLDELELAVVALYEVVPESEKCRFIVPPYERRG